jgi:hypothetical protein
MNIAKPHELPFELAVSGCRLLFRLRQAVPQRIHDKPFVAEVPHIKIVDTPGNGGNQFSTLLLKLQFQLAVVSPKSPFEACTFWAPRIFVSGVTDF